MLVLFSIFLLILLKKNVNIYQKVFQRMIIENNTNDEVNRMKRNNNGYKRQNVGKYIVKSLQNLGGSASKQRIKESIVSDSTNDLTYKDVFEPVVSSRSNNKYIPFNFDFNFGLKELFICGYIEEYNRISDIVLTEKGRKLDPESYPNREDKQIIEKYWTDKHNEKKSDIPLKKDLNDSSDIDKNEDENEENDGLVKFEDLSVKLLDRIKNFTPKKFESFSRKLLSKMGIVFDENKGISMSNDHGIDGYGIFVSDEYRTNKVVIQCKRYTNGPIGEPEIDKFRGVITKHSADYGIFITTTYFTEKAKDAALLVSPTVTLIDGQELINIIVRKKIGLKEVPILYYDIDKYYFEKE